MPKMITIKVPTHNGRRVEATGNVVFLPIGGKRIRFIIQRTFGSDRIDPCLTHHDSGYVMVTGKQIKDILQARQPETGKPRLLTYREAAVIGLNRIVVKKSAECVLRLINERVAIN